MASSWPRADLHRSRIRLRRGYVGRRLASRSGAPARRRRGPAALGPERVCQYRPRPSAQAARHREKIIVAGMVANTCVEATARCGTELGYHVTLIRDATAAFSSEAMHAAHEINGPTFAHAILTTNEVIAALVKP